MALPKKSKKIKKIHRSLDKRGSIVSLIDFKVNNISIITSNSKSIRSNHYHKKDWHFMYVLEGKMNYYFKRNNKVFLIKLRKKDLIYTPPKEIHATYFPMKTVILVASKNKRSKKIYEQDTVRVNFLTYKNMQKIKAGAKLVK